MHVKLARQTGVLVVRSGVIRGARVVVDGEDRGKTPTRVEVIAGQPHVVAVRKPGMQPRSTEVSVAAGETLPVDLLLKPQRVRPR